MKHLKQGLCCLFLLGILTIPAGAVGVQMPFTDVSADAWYHEAVQTAYEHSWMIGLESSKFGPDVNLSRAMFVTVLGRYAEIEASDGSASGYADVKADTWYTPYVQWAEQNNLLPAAWEHTFGVDIPITREEMASILSRYFTVSNLTPPASDIVFQDLNEASDWATEGITQVSGLFSFCEGARFQPQKAVSRAEAAVVFAQLDQTAQAPAAMPDMNQMYLQSLKAFQVENQSAERGAIVFSGSSLMAQFPVNELMEEKGLQATIYNRGIGGSVTTQLLNDIDDIILALEPSKLFINIGTNDLDIISEDYIGDLMANYRKILDIVMEKLPNCEIYVLAYYPPAEGSNFQPPAGKRLRTLDDVQEANRRVKAMAEELGLTFIDLTSVVAKENGYMKDEYSSDGIHMVREAYVQLLDELCQYF